MKKIGRRNIWFLLIIGYTISILMDLSALLNNVSFRNSYLDAIAQSNSIVADGVVNRIEYTLRYGRSLDNYYGIEELFQELQDLCGDLSAVYIALPEGEILYQSSFGRQGFAVPSGLEDALHEMAAAGKIQTWVDGSLQQMILPIRDRSGRTIAGLGICYQTDIVNAAVEEYTSAASLYNLLAVLIGIGLLSVLLFVVKHGFAFKKVLAITISSMIVSNICFVVSSYAVFSSGYMALTQQTSEIYARKIQNDIQSVTSQGIAYSELYGLEDYFNDLSSRTEEIQGISMAPQLEAASSYLHIYSLSPDCTGAAPDLGIQVSQRYVRSQTNKILVGILVSVVTAMMIAAEVIIFVLAVLLNEGKINCSGFKAVQRERESSCQSYGIVRGLAFFFSMFRYMAMAFVSLVIVDIYTPVRFFGYEIPYAIVISLPLTAQMFSSMLGSFLNGKLAGRFGWKPAACLGILFMSLGSLFCGLASSSLPFIGSQLVFGLGLGISKTSIDLYSVAAASDEKMEEYTSNANASTVVGLSCASAIGALIAGTLGYSGAYLIMSCIGVFVAGLFFFFGQNILSDDKGESSKQQQPEKHLRLDMDFICYLLFLVVPYYFVIMFVDYLFPVFANGEGLSTEVIGYILLIYGIVTSYIGTFLCRVLSRKIRTAALMFAILAVLGMGLGAFAIYNSLLLAVFMVLLIALCDGIMPSLQFKFLYSLPSAQRVGFSRMLGMEGFFSGAISAAAPIVFSMVMMHGNAAFMAAAAVLLLCGVLFYWNSRKKTEEKEVIS